MILLDTNFSNQLIANYIKTKLPLMVYELCIELYKTTELCIRISNFLA
jgi:hypothetical protein